MRVDSIVSLGGNCVAAWHVRRHFGIERAGMLDWWIVPFAGLLKLIEDGPSGLFTPEDTLLLPDKTPSSRGRSGSSSTTTFQGIRIAG